MVRLWQRRLERDGRGWAIPGWLSGVSSTKEDSGFDNQGLPITLQTWIARWYDGRMNPYESVDGGDGDPEWEDTRSKIIVGLVGLVAVLLLAWAEGKL